MIYPNDLSVSIWSGFKGPAAVKSCRHPRRIHRQERNALRAGRLYIFLDTSYIFLKTIMAEKAPAKKRLKDFFKALVVLTGIGYALALIGDPFIFILYFQAAFLFFIVFSIRAVFKDLVSLAVFLIFIVTFILEKPELSLALGSLFLVIFTGRSLIKNSLPRRVFTFSSAAIVAALFYLFTAPSAPNPPSLDDSSAKLEALRSLPYTASVNADKNPTKAGVVEFNPDLSAPGLNLYNSYYKAGAHLLDMSGNILREWLPRGTPSEWHCLTACDNGDLLVCIEDTMLMRLDRNSRILWQKEMRAHHDIAIAENKDIYTLVSSDEMAFCRLIPIPVINDSIVILSSDGTIKTKISLCSPLKNKIPILNLVKIYAHMIYPKEFGWRILKQKLAHRPL